MQRVVLALALSAVLPLSAIAQSTTTYQCTMGGNTRRVELVHLRPERVPCEVLYFKDTEAPGERELLWSADVDVGYCEARAAEFVTQLEELGWSCPMISVFTRTPEPVTADEGAPPPAAEPPSVDDTDALGAPEN